MAPVRPPLGSWDELLDADGTPRPAAGCRPPRTLGIAELQARQDLAELAIPPMGITFTVYSEARNIDRAWPFDVIPRVIDAERVGAHRGRPDPAAARAQPVHRRPLRRPADRRRRRLPGRAARRLGQLPARVRRRRTRRSASGPTSAAATSSATPTARCTCSRTTCGCRPACRYMLENRGDHQAGVRRRCSTDQTSSRSTATPTQLLPSCSPSLAPDGVDRPDRRRADAGHLQLGLLRARVPRPADGRPAGRGRATCSSADDDCVYMRTIDGLERVDVIYRRIDDLFLDPEVFRPDSTLGVPGLMRAWQAGNVAHRQRTRRRRRRRQGRLRLRARHHPLLPRRGADPPERADATAASTPTSASTCSTNLDELVVKPANESGGYGMLIGTGPPRPSCAAHRRLIKADPRNYIAQPILRCRPRPRSCDGRIEPRHVDLRPFILSGERPATSPPAG